MSKKNFRILIITLIIFPLAATAQPDAAALIKLVKQKLDKVNDYSARGKLKTDVIFLKVPVATINIFFKKPNKFRITKEKGISILPKGGVNVNMQTALKDDNYQAIDAGKTTINKQQVSIVKLLPNAENSDVILTTLYIDVANLLIVKASTTTKENGSYEVEMSYGKWAEFALPDKLVFSFNTKDYKLPKGITLEFDDGETTDINKAKNKKGKVEIAYQSYQINKGLADDVFK